MNNKLMKLLLILNDLDIGGAQNYTISLMNEFVILGHEVHCVTLSYNNPLKSRLSEKIKLMVLPRARKLDLGVIRKLRQIIISGKYDGIVSSYILYQKLSTFFVKNLPKTIYPIHTTVERSPKSYVLNWISFRLKYKHEVFLTSIDNQTIYLLSKYNLRKGFFQQVYNGVNTDTFCLPPEGFNRSGFLKTLGIPEASKIILMVAGFREEKRHIDAINAFNVLQKRMKDVYLVCVGDNRANERDELKRIIDQRNIKNVVLLVAAEAGDIKNYYWCADLFTLTSNKVETFPITSLESMSCGLPCVLTDTGGSQNIIRKFFLGRVVQPEDIQAIAQAWQETLQETPNVEKLAIRNHVVNHFSIRSSALGYLKIMKNHYANQ